MSETKMKLTRRVQYGHKRYYPECPLSEAICSIVGRKTLTDNDVEVLRKQGEVKFLITEEE